MWSSNCSHVLLSDSYYFTPGAFLMETAPPQVPYTSTLSQTECGHVLGSPWRRVDQFSVVTATLYLSQGKYWIVEKLSCFFLVPLAFMNQHEQKPKKVLFFFFFSFRSIWASPVAQMVKNLPANARDVGPIPGLGRSPGEGNGCLLQYSCLEHSMDRGAWQATVQGVTKSWTQLTD